MNRLARANRKVTSPHLKRADFRTIANILHNYFSLRNADVESESHKKFIKCVHAPVFKSDSDKLMLHIIPPLEHHLMLGVVNTVINHMLEKVLMEKP